MSAQHTTNIPCVAIVLRRDDKVLFLLREHTGWRDGYYCLPSGHVEDDESFTDAAQRELLEETGIKVDPGQLDHALILHHQSDDGVRVTSCFEVEGWTGEPQNAEPHKHAEIAWLDPAKLPENIVESSRFMLQQIAAGQHYAEMGWQATT